MLINTIFIPFKPVINYLLEEAEQMHISESLCFIWVVIGEIKEK